MADVWKLSTEIEPNFDGGFIKAKYLIGGIRTVRTRAQRNNLPYLYRFLSEEASTIVFVESENQFFKLVNNPLGVTSDSDWQVITQSGVSTFRPIGTWESNNTSPVISDATAAGRNGEFYFVVNTPTPETTTIAGLFGGQEVTVVNGDMIVSVGTQWVVVGNATTWDSIVKPDVIVDYVNGTVIDHDHTAADITDLDDYLQDFFTEEDVADPDADFNTVADTDLVSVEFLREHYYRASQIDALLENLSPPAGTPTGPELQKEISDLEYTITEADRRYWLYFTNVLGCNVIIPEGLSEGHIFTAVCGSEAGEITFEPDGDVDLVSSGEELVLKTPGAAANWLHQGDDVWYGFGELGNGISLLNGNGITVNEGAINLGGTLSADVLIQPSTNGTRTFDIGDSSHRLNLMRIYANTLGIFSSTGTIASITAGGAAFRNAVSVSEGGSVNTRITKDKIIFAGDAALSNQINTISGGYFGFYAHGGHLQLSGGSSVNNAEFAPSDGGDLILRGGWASQNGSGYAGDVYIQAGVHSELAAFGVYPKGKIFMDLPVKNYSELDSSDYMVIARQSGAYPGDEYSDFDDFYEIKRVPYVNIARRQVVLEIESTSAIGTGEHAKARVLSPATGTIVAWKLITDQDTTLTLDVWKRTGAIPTNTQSTGLKPSLSAASFTHGSASISVTENDIIALEVEANNNAQKIKLMLMISPSV
jgi:hypothetical protein